MTPKPTETSNDTCCKSGPMPGCGCASAAKTAPAAERGCCCGSQCSCGDSCPCPNGCGC